MSISVTKRVWEYSESLHKERIMLLALADCADDQGLCYPSIAHLADKCRVSESTAKRLIKKIVSRGELQIVRVGGVYGTMRRSNLYRVTVFYPFRPTDKRSYHCYLLSPEWRELRSRKIKEAGYRCQLCNSRGRLEVHHRTYENVGHESMRDLIALCDECHQRFHNILPHPEAAQ